MLTVQLYDLTIFNHMISIAISFLQEPGMFNTVALSSEATVRWRTKIKARWTKPFTSTPFFHKKMAQIDFIPYSSYIFS